MIVGGYEDGILDAGSTPMLLTLVRTLSARLLLPSTLPSDSASPSSSPRLKPSPKCALTPPRFRTRNRPDFLNAQFSMNPKSESSTQVLSNCLIVHKKQNANSSRLNTRSRFMVGILCTTVFTFR
uniref:(northern house mosquito) hypothetical protein n=2 Tax=Culex pipiens TaxID=7175 RepID=A0A8D8J8S3_CULPI